MRILVIALIVLAGVAGVLLRHRGPSVEIRGHRLGVDIADTAPSWTKGLAGRDSLPADRGMLFLFPDTAPRSFWMKGMRFPIDIIWIHNGRIAGIASDAQPEPGTPDAMLIIYSSPEPVDAVLEAAAGTAGRLGIRTGDAVSVTR